MLPPQRLLLLSLLVLLLIRPLLLLLLSLELFPSCLVVSMKSYCFISSAMSLMSLML